MTKNLLFALCIAAIGCGEPTSPLTPPADPCATKGACEVAGVDLVVDRLDILVEPDRLMDPDNAEAIYQNFDSVTIFYRVRNRGDAASDSANAFVSSCNRCSNGHNAYVPIKALQPGQADSGAVRVQAAEYSGSTTIVHPLIILPAIDEPFYKNNELVSPSTYEVVAPTYRGSLQLLSAEVRMGQHVKLVLIVTNTSRFGILRDTTMAFCMRRTDYAEYQEIDYCHNQFGRFAYPHLLPGQTRVDTVDVVLANNSSYYEKHTRIPIHFDACLGGEAPFGFSQCAASAATTLMPDVETACAVPALTFGVDTAASFDNACYIYLAQFNVWKVELESGINYLFTSTAGQIGVWDRDGNPIAQDSALRTLVTAPSTGRYYLVVHRPYSTTAYDYTVRVDRRSN